MKLVQIKGPNSVIQHRIDWFVCIESKMQKRAKKPDVAILTATFLEPGLLRSGLVADQIKTLNLGVIYEIEFDSVADAMASISIISLE